MDVLPFSRIEETTIQDAGQSNFDIISEGGMRGKGYREGDREGGRKAGGVR